MENHSHFDEFILYRSLSLKFSGSHILDFPDEASDSSNLRNVCAKLHPDLVDRLDTVLGLLGMSKREFIQIALIDALDRAEKTLDDVDALGPHYVEKNQS
jgi:hypothetical protein